MNKVASLPSKKRSPTLSEGFRAQDWISSVVQVVRTYSKDKGVYQEFSHVGTPEDNAYIEAFHSNLQREVIDRYEFDSIYHAQMVLDRYYEWYNEKRRHGALQRQTPNQVFQNINLMPFENEKLLNYLLENCPGYKGSRHYAVEHPEHECVEDF